MEFKYLSEKETGLILVNAEIDGKYELSMILDTGATNTTIDSNALHMLGYDLRDSIGLVEIETANGIVTTELFEIKTFSMFGIVKSKYQVQVYDFLAHGVFSDYDGLLGMDFWQGNKFCIDTDRKTITINTNN
jgi:predicted aspartyl protease